MSQLVDPLIGRPALLTYDPVRYCVYTTVALLALILSPPVVLAWMAGLGLWGYAKAWRSGARTSRCWLRDIRLVLAYLGASAALGLALAIREFSDLV